MNVNYLLYLWWLVFIFLPKIIQIFSNSGNNNAKNTFIVFDIVSYETRSTAYDIVFRKVFFFVSKVHCIHFHFGGRKKGGGLAFENYGCFVIWVRRSHIVKLYTKMALQNIVCLWINISISASIFLCDYRRYIKLLSVHRTLNILYTDGAGMLQKWECMQFWWMDVLWNEEKKKNKSKCHRYRLVSMNEWSPKRNEKVHLNFHAS